MGLILFLAALIAPRALPIAALPLAVSIAWSIAPAWRAPVDPRFSGVRSRALIALLTWLGPLVRGTQRYLWRLRGMSQLTASSARARSSRRASMAPARLHRRLTGATRGTEGSLPRQRDGFLIPRKYLIAVDPGWNAGPGGLRALSKARIAAAVENHGGNKRLLNVAARCG